MDSLAAVKVSMLLLASGRGERLGASVPKAFVELAGEPLVVRSMRRLAAVTDDREIVLAVQACDREAFVNPILESLRAAGLDRVVDGGATRQESMERAFEASTADSDVVLIHDAARPFFSIEATRQAIAIAIEVGGAVLATPVADTIKRVDEAGCVIETVERSGLWAAQTPQLCRRDALARSIEIARRDRFLATDDVSLLEYAGIAVQVVEGSRRNIKVTTPADMEIAEHLASSEDP
ncbi:MAG: 2-C-methyl-D-erythritol 4-phosphate cytidylyltransferase [Planctomycetes bacterium]|nr:2-C-methyl-D-erythritol 4-phosphate cytidylyltransferase [Planctomycetota bacterium]